MRSRRRFISAPYSGPELIHRVRNAVFLAGFAMLCSLPVAYYHFRQLDAAVAAESASLDLLFGLAQNQSLLVFMIALLSSLVGCLYAERLGLPGLQGGLPILVWLGMGVLLGLLLAPATFLLVDHSHFHEYPLLYPRPWPWALATMVNSAVSQEVVFRFGLLTIGLYFLFWWGFEGYPWPALLLVSLFGVGGYYAMLVKFNMVTQLSQITLAALLLFVMALQWFLGEVYLRKGLLIAIAFHFGISVRFLIYPLLWD